MMKYNYWNFLYLALFFIFIWLSVNWNHIALGINSNSIIDVTTSYAGYNFLMLHGTVYTLLYLLLLLSNNSLHLNQLVIRMRRKDIIRKMVFKVVFLSFLFVGVYTLIHVAMLTIFADISLLVEKGFYIGAIISFINTSFLYSMLGFAFLILYIITFSEVKSLVFTFIFSTLLVCSDLILGWKTPFSDIVVYDTLLSTSKVYVFQYLFIYLKDFLILASLYAGLIIIFKEKDILHV